MMQEKIRIIVQTLSTDVMLKDYGINPEDSNDTLGIQFLKAIKKSQGAYYLTFTPTNTALDYLLVTYNNEVIAFAGVKWDKLDDTVDKGEKTYKSKLILKEDEVYAIRGLSKRKLKQNMENNGITWGSNQRPYISYTAERNDLISDLLDCGAAVARVDLNSNNPYVDNLACNEIRCIIDDSECRSFYTEKGVCYNESHHLIPKKYAEEFPEGDVEDKRNRVPLCPLHHRMIHLAQKKDRDKLIDNLYEKQISQLREAGLGITKERLMELYD